MTFKSKQAKANKRNSAEATKKRKSDAAKRKSADELPFSRLQPCKRPRAGAGDAAGLPARRPSWVAFLMAMLFDGMLEGCHKRDAFDGRVEESEWDANEFDGELRERRLYDVML